MNERRHTLPLSRHDKQQLLPSRCTTTYRSSHRVEATYIIHLVHAQLNPKERNSVASPIRYRDACRLEKMAKSEDLENAPPPVSAHPRFEPKLVLGVITSTSHRESFFSDNTSTGTRYSGTLLLLLCVHRYVHVPLSVVLSDIVTWYYCLLE